MEGLGSSIYNALRRVFRAAVVDEALVKELVRDVQRALLQADVNAGLVLELSSRIEERALREKIPPGVSRREHLIKVVYEELVRFLGEKPAPLKLKSGERNVLMLVGIQGSGKTTSAAKLAYYFKKRGRRVALICADTYRPGAYAQLSQLGEQVGVPVYGEQDGVDPVKIALNGLKKFEDYDLVIIDTAGRHKEEKQLIMEMKQLAEAIKPDEVMLVVDATIGQQAATQAEAFHEATPLGSIFLAKLDGSARGGGALSAVAATGAKIKFIGTGERIEDVEHFVPTSFVGRLLGMGDLQGLIEKVREAELAMPRERVKAILSGKFTLTDMYEQLEALRGMGRFRKLLGMIPGFSYELPEEAVEVAEEKMERWRYIIQSMTLEERENPKIIKSSRIRRIARGSGTTEKDVKELIKYYFTMKKMFKRLKKGRLPASLRRKGMRMKIGMA